MSGLVDLLAEDLSAGAVPDAIMGLVEEIRARHGDAVRAVLFYGSCRRRGSGEGLADLLVLVDSYARVHRSPFMRLLNRILPPNVYYLEYRAGEQVQRCKYALASLDGFERRCGRGLDAYFRARFCQPCRLAWHADEQARDQVLRARQAALLTFAGEFAPLLEGRHGSLEFWEALFSASYRCELRPEPPGAARKLVHADADYYNAAAHLILPGLAGVSGQQEPWRFRPAPSARLRARVRWGWRRFWGKVLNVLRLLKAAGTFSNGIDYILWKIERHSGVRIEASDWMRRHPRLAAIGLAWKIWRRKVLQ